PAGSRRPRTARASRSGNSGNATANWPNTNVSRAAAPPGRDSMAEAPAFASSAPVFKVNGTRAADLARDVVRLDIEETTEGLRTFTAQFLGSAPRDQPSNDVVEYLDGALLDFGKRLEVSLGPPGNEKIVFTGVVSALEVNFTEGDVPVVVVSAED